MDNTRLTSTQEALVHDNLEYACQIANKMSRKFSNAVIDSDDMEQLAYKGLVQAAKRFDPSLYDGRDTLANFFKKYAYSRIVGAIKDEMRSLAFERRRGQEQELSFQMLSIDMAGEWEDGNPWLKELCFDSTDDTLIDFQAAISTLNDRQKRVMLGMVMGETYKEIGGELGVSESRVSQIATEAKQMLLKRIT